MKRFLGFVKKEFIHIFRDYLTMIILFGIPAILVMLFGFVISMELKNASVAVLDLSRDEMTQKITDRIWSSGFFEKGENLTGYHELEETLRGSKSKAVIIFGEDFSERLISEGKASISVITDGSEPNVATQTTNFITAIVGDFNRELSAGIIPANLLVSSEVRMFYNPTLKSQFMFVPGVITMIMILICALMTSITLTREKEFGTMEALLASPLKPAHIIIGKVVPYFFISLIDAILILVLSWLVFGLKVQGSLLLLLAELMLYILMSLSLGILVSSIAKTMQQAIFVTLVGGMLPTVLLSGFIVPIESMPEIYQWISTLLPPRYFIVILKNIMIKGTGLAFVWKETLILLAFTVFFMVVSLRSFKTRLQ
jgi:ABC-2 type transport system permease protein